PVLLSLLLRPRPPTATLFPYTTLFRSRHVRRPPAQPHPQRLLSVQRAEHGAARPTRRRVRLRRGHQRDLPRAPPRRLRPQPRVRDRKSTRLNSSHVKISYAVFCLKNKN